MASCSTSASGDALGAEVFDRVAALVFENALVADRIDGDGLARPICSTGAACTVGT